MKKTIFAFILVSVFFNKVLAQVKDGLIPYKTLEQTIGENYTFVKRALINPFNYKLKKNDGSAVLKADFGKSLKLISIEQQENTAHLVDSVGLIYIVGTIDNKEMPDLILKSELEDARKLFLNKTLWLNVTEIQAGKNKDEGTGKTINGLKFEQVVVTAISPGYINGAPILFTLKTKTGQYGYVDCSISGTNTDRDPKNSFTHYFLTEDPHLKYHFTPAVWKMVQAGYTEIGMPMEAFQLVMGPADKINTTQTAKGVTQQWVYGSSYYYFAGGKLTAKQN